MRKSIFIIIFSLFLFSCEKEKPLLIIENTDIPLIIRVLDNDQVYRVFSYNGSNLLSEDRTKFTYIKYNYNENNQLISSDFYVDPAMFSSSSSVIENAYAREEWISPDNTEKSLTQSFNYDTDGKLIKQIYTRPSVSNSEYSEFMWNDGRISRRTMYYKDEISGYIDYLYDDKGNLTKESKYYVPSNGDTVLQTTTEYEYDNMKNPFRVFKRLINPGKYTNLNNIIKRTYTIHFEVDEWTQKIQVTHNSYEYDDNDYPVKVNGEIEYVYR